MKQWQTFLAAAVIIVLLLMMGGGMAIMRLARFALPAVVIYFIYSAVRAQFLPQEKNNGNDARLRQQQPTSMAQSQPVIEICPQCGEEKGRKHKCST